MNNFGYWSLMFLLVIIIGLIINAILTSILNIFIAKKEKKKYKETFITVFKQNLSYSYALALVSILLYSLKKKYQVKVEFFILSIILTASIISGIETKNLYNFVIGAIILIYPFIKWSVKKIIKSVKKKEISSSQNEDK